MNKRIVLVIIGLCEVFNLFGQQIEQISDGEFSQIGNEFSLNGQYFVYTDVAVNKKKKMIEYGFNLIATSNPKVVNYHHDNFRFIGFVRDSVILGLNNANKIYTFNTITEKTLKEYDITLGNDIYSTFNFKFKNENLYYLKENNLVAYSLSSCSNSVLFNLKNFSSDYSDIVSFDIKEDTVAFCFKEKNSAKEIYDFYLFSLSSKELSLIKKGENTDEKTYSPIVRFAQNHEIIYSYYSDKKASLHFVNYLTKEESKKQSIGDYGIINFSISSIGQEYTSLFNDKERQELAKKYAKRPNLGVLLSGCHVYNLK